MRYLPLSDNSEQDKIPVDVVCASCYGKFTNTSEDYDIGYVFLEDGTIHRKVRCKCPLCGAFLRLANAPRAYMYKISADYRPNNPDHPTYYVYGGTAKEAKQRLLSICPYFKVYTAEKLDDASAYKIHSDPYHHCII
nr:MAG TPA: LysW biosynthesis protein LysW [Caudoviricetes sp.]